MLTTFQTKSYKVLKKFNQFVNQFFLFGFLGVLLNLISYMSFCLLVLFGVPYKFSVSIVYCVFFFINFFIYKKKIFESANYSKYIFLKYITSHVLIYILNFLILFISVEIYGLNTFLSQFLIIIFLGSFMFYLYKFWVYK